MVWAAIRYRRGQALLVAALSALLVACAVFAAVYERALEQALLRVELGQVSATTGGLTLTSASAANPSSVATPQQLRALLPPVVLAVSQPPILARSVQLDVPPGPSRLTLGPAEMVAAEGLCGHLRFPTGRCPTARNEVVVSAPDATLHRWPVGTRLRVSEAILNVASGLSPTKTLTVVGSYVPLAGDFWSWTSLTGRSGTVDNSEPHSTKVQLDSWLTSTATMEGPLATIGSIRPNGTSQLSTGTTDPTASWAGMRSTLVVPLDKAALDLASVGRLNRTIVSLESRDFSPRPVTVSSALPSVVTQLDAGRGQAGVIVPLLMAQLGLLAVVVLRLVVVSAVDQRRPEVALTRLRGGGSGSSRRLLVAELGTLVLAGAVPGVLVALALAEVARRVWLVPGVPFEVPSTAAWALVTALLLGMALVLAASRSVVREPVADLLRRVPARGGRLTLGLVDIAVVVAAAAGVLALATSKVSGPLALATPALLALAVGLVLARLGAAAAGYVGRRALGSGRVGTALSALQIARRPGVRGVVSVLTVAVALTVFAADAFVVARRNREVRAQVEIGAPAVVTVAGGDVTVVRAAVASVDRGGRQLTPVAIVQPVGEGGVTTLAVLPDQFRHVSLLPGADPAGVRWSALALPSVPPLRVAGSTLSLTVRGVDVTQPPGQVSYNERGLPVSLPPTPPMLSLQLVASDGQLVTVRLGKLPFGRSAPRVLSAAVPCSIGCAVVGITVRSSGSAATQGSVLVGSLTGGSEAMPVGPENHWVDLPPARDSRDSFAITSVAGSSEQALLRFNDESGLDITLRHASTSARLPALTAGSLPAGSTGERFQAGGLDGVSRDMIRVGTLPYGPGVGRDAAMVNLELLQRTGMQAAPVATLQVWAARDDPALLSRLRAALRAFGLREESTVSVAGAAAGFGRSASAWGLRLALVLGGAGLLLAALVLAVSTSTMGRQRSGDYAALRMAGLSDAMVRKAAVREQLALVAVATVGGVGSGLLGAWLALPILPLFTTPPAVDRVDLAPAWDVVAMASAAALLVLALAGAFVAIRLARSAALTRLREPL